MARIQLLAYSNGVGNSRDIHLLAQPLRDLGHELTVTLVSRGARRSRRWRLLAWWVRLRRALGGGAAPPYDLNLMLEHVWPGYLTLARRNVLVPNPEWFDRHDRRLLPLLDGLWAKTRYSQGLFEALGKPVSYTGFDSVDRCVATVARQARFFHLAGKSRMKGTARLLALWSRHPEWPLLCVVLSRRLQAQLPVADNIQYRSEYLEDAQLAQLQNAHLFHLCTSETEGWGHYIPEALSTGAVVIATDAPPMNELVGPDRGLLVAAREHGRQHLAATYAFDEAALEAAVGQVLVLDGAQRQALGTSARAWFLANQQGFPERLRQALAASGVQAA